MRLGKRQRKWLLGVGCTLGAVLVLWVSIPLWFPWALSPLASKQGLHYSSYVRRGYSRFELRGVGFTNQSIKLHVNRVEGLTPTTWLWRSTFAGTKDQRAFVSVHGWQLEITNTNQAGRKPDESSSVYTNVYQTAGVLDKLERWLPSAVLSNGTLLVPKTAVVRIPAAVWSQGTLSAQVRLAEPEQDVDLKATFRPGQPVEVLSHSESLHLESVARVSFDLAGVAVQSTNLWWSNRFEFEAKFGRNGTLPETASLHSQNFSFPAELIHLKEYRDIAGSIRGSGRTRNLRLRWMPEHGRSHHKPICRRSRLCCKREVIPIRPQLHPQPSLLLGSRPDSPEQRPCTTADHCCANPLP